MPGCEIIRNAPRGFVGFRDPDGGVIGYMNVTKVAAVWTGTRRDPAVNVDRLDPGSAIIYAGDEGFEVRMPVEDVMSAVDSELRKLYPAPSPRSPAARRQAVEDHRTGILLRHGPRV